MSIRRSTDRKRTRSTHRTTNHLDATANAPTPHPATSFATPSRSRPQKASLPLRSA